MLTLTTTTKITTGRNRSSTTAAAHRTHLSDNNFVQKHRTMIRTSPALTTLIVTLIVVAALMMICRVEGLQIVIPGGTGKLGKILLPMLSNHDCMVLTRNAFLASAPSKVSSDFGYLGLPMLEKNRHVKLRDYDGGDLLEIVGQDFIGWQEDSLPKADVLIHLVGGYTEQRNMVTERLVREAIRLNPNILHITVNPTEEDIPKISPGMMTVKTQRIKQCEDMVRQNCLNTKCLRLEAFRDEQACQAIVDAISEWEQEQQ